MNYEKLFFWLAVISFLLTFALYMASKELYDKRKEFKEEARKLKEEFERKFLYYLKETMDAIFSKLIKTQQNHLEVGGLQERWKEILSKDTSYLFQNANHLTYHMVENLHLEFGDLKAKAKELSDLTGESYKTWYYWVVNPQRRIESLLAFKKIICIDFDQKWDNLLKSLKEKSA